MLGTLTTECFWKAQGKDKLVYYNPKAADMLLTWIKQLATRCQCVDFGLDPEVLPQQNHAVSHYAMRWAPCHVLHRSYTTWTLSPTAEVMQWIEFIWLRSTRRRSHCHKLVCLYATCSSRSSHPNQTYLNHTNNATTYSSNLTKFNTPLQPPKAYPQP